MTEKLLTGTLSLYTNKQTILQQSISSVKVKVVLGEKIVSLKMIFFLEFFVSYVFIYRRDKMRHEFIFIFMKYMYFTQFFLLTQESPFILAYSGKISFLIHTDTTVCYDHRSSVEYMLDSDDAFTECLGVEYCSVSG